MGKVIYKRSESNETIQYDIQEKYDQDLWVGIVVDRLQSWVNHTREWKHEYIHKLITHFCMGQPSSTFINKLIEK